MRKSLLCICAVLALFVVVRNVRADVEPQKVNVVGQYLVELTGKTITSKGVLLTLTSSGGMRIEGKINDVKVDLVGAYVDKQKKRKALVVGQAIDAQNPKKVAVAIYCVIDGKGNLKGIMMTPDKKFAKMTGKKI